MAALDLPAVNSDVNVIVTTMNAFGSGPASNISVDEISELHIRMYMYTYIRMFMCKMYILVINIRRLLRMYTYVNM